MSGSTLSTKPDRSTTEDLRSQITSGNPRGPIFDFLVANPNHRFTYREIGEAVDQNKNNVRKYIFEMRDETFEIGDRRFEGIVDCVRDGRAKRWQLKEEVRKEVDQDRNESVQEVFDDHYPLVGVFVFAVVFGALLMATEMVTAMQFGSLTTLSLYGGIVGLATMTVIAIKEIGK